MRLWPCVILTCRQGNDVSAAGWAFADIPVIERFEDSRRIKILKPGNIFHTAKQVTAQCNLLAFIPGIKQAVMPDPHKTLWRDMHEKSPGGFLPGKCELLPLPMIFVILNSKRNRGIRHTFYAAVAYGNPVGIFAKIFDNRPRTVKWLLAIRNPFFGVAGVQKFLKSIMILIRLCCTVEFQFFVNP